MTKHITVKLTADQARHLVAVLTEFEADHYDTMTKQANAFSFRIIQKLNAELVR